LFSLNNYWTSAACSVSGFSARPVPLLRSIYPGFRSFLIILDPGNYLNCITLPRTQPSDRSLGGSTVWEPILFACTSTDVPRGRPIPLPSLCSRRHYAQFLRRIIICRQHNPANWFTIRLGYQTVLPVGIPGTQVSHDYFRNSTVKLVRPTDLFRVILLP